MKKLNKEEPCEWLDALIRETLPRMAHCEDCPLGINTDRGRTLAGRDEIRATLDDLLAALFPGCHGGGPVPAADLGRHVEARLRRAGMALANQIEGALRYQCEADRCRDCGDCAARAREAVKRLLLVIPDLQTLLRGDILAAYDGDPAARSPLEVVMSYPGLYAIAVHRVAHVLHEAGVPLIPRVMSEYAHSLTGIDIHPGARIGSGFFIDHGTGVVIGETCKIGRNVKIYQGVTLGALSFEKDEQGRPIKGVKRHPDVGDGVVIYAGATILGGATTIGAHSVIGGNVWLTHSVPPNSRVYNRQPKPLIREGGPETGVGGDGDAHGPA